MPEDEDIVVKAPDEGVVAPITVLSITPPLMSTVANVACPDVDTVVNAPEEAVVAPIVALSTVPPLISAVSATRLSI